MASAVRRSPNAFVAEVARYLALDPADVRRCIDKDGLPAIAIPKATRTVYRVYLPALHEWLLSRAINANQTLRDYSRFLAEFDEITDRKTL